jgi:hypothetical protein
MTDNLYQQPEVVNKRPRYFDGQYLKVDDFINEQQYHVDRRRRVSQHLHVAGILTGLEVQVDGNTLTIAPGAAIDHQGRQIILHQLAVYQAPTDDADSAQTITVGSNQQFTIDLAGVDTQATYQLFLAWEEIGSDKQSTEQGGSAEATRFHERPRLSLGTTAPDNSIVLAKIKHNGSVWVKEAFAPQYSGLQLPTSDGTGIAFRSLNGASDLAHLSSSLTIDGALTVAKTSAFIGNVGINQSNPTSLLEIGNPSNDVPAMKIGRKASNPSIQGLGDWLILDGGQVGLNYWSNENVILTKGGGNVGIGTTDPKIHLAIGDNDTGFKQQGDGELAVYTNNNERVRIDEYGKVGIGFTNPSERLSVNGKLYVSGNLGIGTTDPKIHLAIGDNDTGFKQQGDGELAIYTNNSERVRINEYGRVGIGFTNPSSRLAVNGGLHVGGDSNPGDNNLEVDGKLTVSGNTSSTITGSLGIGHSSPNAKLHVKQSGSANAAHLKEVMVLTSLMLAAKTMPFIYTMLIQNILHFG